MLRDILLKCPTRIGSSRSIPDDSLQHPSLVKSPNVKMLESSYLHGWHGDADTLPSKLHGMCATIDVEIMMEMVRLLPHRRFVVLLIPAPPHKVGYTMWRLRIIHGESVAGTYGVFATNDPQRSALLLDQIHLRLVRAILLMRVDSTLPVHPVITQFALNAPLRGYRYELRQLRQWQAQAASDGRVFRDGEEEEKEKEGDRYYPPLDDRGVPIEGPQVLVKVPVVDSLCEMWSYYVVAYTLAKSVVPRFLRLEETGVISIPTPSSAGYYMLALLPRLISEWAEYRRDPGVSLTTEFRNSYLRYKGWDSLLHMIGAFCCQGVGTHVTQKRSTAYDTLRTHMMHAQEMETMREILETEAYNDMFPELRAIIQAAVSRPKEKMYPPDGPHTGKGSCFYVVGPWYERSVFSPGRYPTDINPVHYVYDFIVSDEHALATNLRLQLLAGVVLRYGYGNAMPPLGDAGGLQPVSLKKRHNVRMESAYSACLNNYSSTCRVVNRASPARIQLTSTPLGIEQTRMYHTSMVMQMALHLNRFRSKQKKEGDDVAALNRASGQCRIPWRFMFAQWVPENAPLHGVEYHPQLSFPVHYKDGKIDGRALKRLAGARYTGPEGMPEKLEGDLRAFKGELVHSENFFCVFEMDGDFWSRARPSNAGTQWFRYELTCGHDHTYWEAVRRALRLTKEVPPYVATVPLGAHREMVALLTPYSQEARQAKQVYEEFPKKTPAVAAKPSKPRRQLDEVDDDDDAPPVIDTARPGLGLRDMLLRR